jgi:hypothetical protein
MKELRARRGTVGGVFRTRGSTLEAHEEWTAVITEQELEMGSPISR